MPIWFAVFVGACAATPPSDPPLEPLPAPAIVLDRIPSTHLGCDLMRMGYQELQFLIRPGEPVIAVADRVKRLPTAWEDGLVPDPAGARLIRDRAGQVVVRDLQTLAIPPDGWPHLAGHIVCPGPTNVWIFDEDP